MLMGWKCCRIQFLEAAVGAVEPVARLRLKIRRGWKVVACPICLGWGGGYIRICGADRQMLTGELGLGEPEVQVLEKVLYWHYGWIVRSYLYGETLSLLDYSGIFGRNLQTLRESNGQTDGQLAQALGISRERQSGFEVGTQRIEADLCMEKTNSVLFCAAAYFQIPAAELLSPGLFYHVPIAGINVCAEEMGRIVKKYNRKYGKKEYRLGR